MAVGRVKTLSVGERSGVARVLRQGATVYPFLVVTLLVGTTITLQVGTTMTHKLGAKPGPHISSSRHIRTLVVDDSALFLNKVCSRLERESSIELVGRAKRQIEALAKIALLEPEVVVLDMQMHGLTGLELAGLIRRHAPKVRIVIMTALETRAARRACLRAGAHGIVRKSRFAADLPKEIHRVFGKPTHKRSQSADPFHPRLFR